MWAPILFTSDCGFGTGISRGINRRDPADDSHDLLEVVLRAQFLPEINILLLQPSLQAGDLLVGLHILNGQCNLVRHLLQESGILIRILTALLAHDAEQADTLSLKDNGHDAN